LAEHLGDQAAGLRRLFAKERTRIVTFAAGANGLGQSLLVANLAASIARQGKEVLVLDETMKNNVASYFGSRGRYDLQHVINGEKSLSEVLLNLAPGVRVLPMARAVKRLGKLNPLQQHSLMQGFAGFGAPADVILVDSSLDHPLGFSPLGLVAHETIVLVEPKGVSITDAYALIKKVSLGYARRDFRILVNKVRGSEEAESIFGNIAHVTHSRKLARLEYAGFVPLDGQLCQAAKLSQSVVELFPEAPAAKTIRAIASELLDWPLPENDSGGLEHFVQQLLHLSQRIDPVAIYA